LSSASHTPPCLVPWQPPSPFFSYSQTRPFPSFQGRVMTTCTRNFHTWCSTGCNASFVLVFICLDKMHHHLFYNITPAAMSIPLSISTYITLFRYN
jgi:hypothetical protein